jgi:hypothetical protein
MTRPINFTLTFASRGDGVEDDLTLEEVARYLSQGGEPGNQYDAISILEQYGQGAEVTVHMERGGESVELRVPAS